VRVKIELNDFTYPKYRRGDWTIDLGGIPVRWFPAEWSIKDRKQHESFVAVLKDIPNSLTVQSIWKGGKLHELFEGVHAFKIIKEGNERRLIGYFKTWQDMKVLIGSGIVWEKKELRWCSHTLPTFKKKPLNKQKPSLGTSSKNPKKNPKQPSKKFADSSSKPGPRVRPKPKNKDSGDMIKAKKIMKLLADLISKEL
jgi:hypothetical protein